MAKVYFTKEISPEGLSYVKELIRDWGERFCHMLSRWGLGVGNTSWWKYNRNWAEAR